MAKLSAFRWPSRLGIAAFRLGGGLRRAGRAALGQRRYERLKGAAVRLRHAISDDDAQRAERAMADWLVGNADAAVRVWRKLAASQPLVAEWPFRLAFAADMYGDHAAAERIVTQAWARGARSAELAERIAFFKRWNRLSNAAGEDAAAIVRDPAASPLMVYKATGYLLGEGLLDAAREGIARLAGHPQFEGGVLTLSTALAVLEQAMAEGRALSGSLSPARDALALREPGADTSVIVFTSVLGDCSGPVNAMHALLQAAKVNAIYLFDERKLFNLGGSTTYGRPYPAMLDGLRRQLDAWGTRTLVTIGFSGAGFTALRVGLDLKAHGVLGLNPVTSLYRAPEFPIARATEFVEARMAYLEAHMRATVPEIMTNLKDELSARDCCARIEIHHGDSNLSDLFQAYNVAGVTGVTLHAIKDFRRHECLTELIRRGNPNPVADFIARVRQDQSIRR
jgi:hypothetical protein